VVAAVSIDQSASGAKPGALGQDIELAQIQRVALEQIWTGNKVASRPGLRTYRFLGENTGGVQMEDLNDLFAARSGDTSKA
jgi:hypothetical protein